MTGELRSFRKRRLTPEEGKRAAQRALSTPIRDRRGQESGFSLDDPETLLPLLESLRQLAESNLAVVLEESSYLYQFLEKLDTEYPIGLFLLDERQYFLGETACLAGRVSRELSKRQEARRWLDLSEGWFLQTENSSGNMAKVSYQRLALRTEERDFDAVMELLPQLIATFEKLGMYEDALKSRFLQAVILKETEHFREAAEAFQSIGEKAAEIQKDNLVAQAYVNRVQIHAVLGESPQAIALAQEAMPILKRFGNRIGLAKLQWGLGHLLRSRRELSGAVEAFRISQKEFADLQMRADVAATHLVIADLLLDNDQEKQAEWEIRQALPIIDEYKLVPEGMAAFSLLRESVRRQKIDRQALRNLHGYFEELQG